VITVKEKLVENLGNSYENGTKAGRIVGKVGKLSGIVREDVGRVGENWC
jgi:hypothetical protein